MALLPRVIYGASFNYADVVAPTYTSSSIPAAGTTLIDTYNEALSATITTGTGRTITLSGGAATLSGPVASGSTVTWTLSRTVNSGETCSANAYTAPGTGIKDVAGNFAATYTGRQADVTNNSTVSGGPTELFADNFNRGADFTGLGSNWDCSNTPIGGATVEWYVLSNTALANSGAGIALARVKTSAASCNENQYAQATFGTGGSDYFTSPALRIQSTSDARHYRIEYTGGNIQWQKITDSTTLAKSAVGSTASVASYGAGDVIKVSAEGTSTVTLKAYRNGTLVLTSTDSSSPLSGGQPGLVGPAGAIWDDFSCGNT